MPSSPKRARSGAVLLPAPAAISTRAVRKMTPFAGVLGRSRLSVLCGLLGRLGRCAGFWGVVDGCNVVAAQRNAFVLLGVR
jgi:hypothetical protein